jgi:hypothetical protein
MKWIKAVWVRKSPSGKTNVWEMRTTDYHHLLGEVRWYSPWRKYAFFPAAECVFEQDCLRDIAAFIEEATMEHKRGS